MTFFPLFLTHSIQPLGIVKHHLPLLNVFVWQDVSFARVIHISLLHSGTWEMALKFHNVGYDFLCLNMKPIFQHESVKTYG